MAAKSASGLCMKHQEPNKGKNVSLKRPPSGGNRRLKHSSSSSLEILDPEDSLKSGPGSKSDLYDENRPPSSGRKSTNVGSVPPRPDSSLIRRTPTPTKQISLQAVKRKEDRDDPIVTDIDWKELQSHSRHKGRKDVTDQFREMTITDKGKNHSNESSIPFSYSSRKHNCSHHHDDTEKVGKREKPKEQSQVQKELKNAPTKGEKCLTDEDPLGAVGGKVDSSNSSDTDSEEEEEEERKAPNELLMEFVTCLMEKDYPNAQKLCKMILLYEPENQEALKFQPLIEEKIALDNEPGTDSGESEEEGDDYGDDDENDDDDDDDDSEDTDSDSDTSDSDSEEEEDNDEIPEENRLDSGIASAMGSDCQL